MTRFSKIAHLLTATLALALGAACGGDDGPMGLDPSQFELVTVSGAGQQGVAGTVLFDPLVVRVRSRSTAAPEPGVIVRWKSLQGSATPTRATSGTDSQGLAGTRAELGATAGGGGAVIEASVAGLPAVTFQLTVLPAPTIDGVAPAAANAGDAVDVQMANVPPGEAVQVLFDGVAGQIVSQSTAPPIVVRAIVPAPTGVCGASVQTVKVRARVAGLTTGSVDLSVTVPPNPFQVGQVLVIQGTADAQCALLPAASGQAKYLLVAMSAEFEVNGTFQVTLGAGNIALGAAQGERPLGPTGFHSRLRALEQQLAARGLARARPPTGAHLFAEPDVGSTQEFSALNNVNFSGGAPDQADFDRVTATLKYKGPHTLLYIDNAAPSPGLTQADIDFLGQLYDERLYDADVDFFGEPTDVDANERVIVLLTPVVNSLTEPGAQGVVIGFFFGLDLFSPNAAGCPECQFSNNAELLYGIVPDPDAIFSDARTRQRVLDLLPGVMIHETQHMISFRFKIFELNQLALETLWLSEALAHAAEEIGGDAVDAAGQTSVAVELFEPNLARGLSYLEEPSKHSLTTVDGSGSLQERGAGWLFLRWIADQYGDFIFRDLTQAAPNGFANVEAQTGESFFSLFADWAVALWADDQTITNLPVRYQIPKWQLRSVLVVGDPPMYALQPLQHTFATFRANTIAEFLAATSPFYVELDAAGDMSDLPLQLSASTDAGLAILRIQ